MSRVDSVMRALLGPSQTDQGTPARLSGPARPAADATRTPTQPGPKADHASVGGRTAPAAISLRAAEEALFAADVADEGLARADGLLEDLRRVVTEVVEGGAPPASRQTQAGSLQRALGLVIDQTRFGDRSLLAGRDGAGAGPAISRLAEDPRVADLGAADDALPADIDGARAAIERDRSVLSAYRERLVNDARAELGPEVREPDELGADAALAVRALVADDPELLARAAGSVSPTDAIDLLS